MLIGMFTSRIYVTIYVTRYVTYVSAKTPCGAGEQLTQALQDISRWLELSHLTLNVKKKVSMCFSIRNRPVQDTFEVLIKIK